MAEPFFDHGHQPLMLLHIGIETAHAAQFSNPPGAVDGVDQVPGGQVEIDAAGHFASRAIRANRTQGAVAELAQDAGQLDVAVEVGAGDVYAVVGQDVVATVQTLHALRAHAHHREVRSTAADVGHQHDAFAVDLALVVEGRGNRLELEMHFIETHSMSRRFQRALRCGVALRFTVHEKHRTAQHQLVQGAGRSIGQRAVAQALQVAGEDVAVLGATAAADVGRLVDQTGSEDALHRAHQAPVDAVHIGRHGGAAKGARRAVGVVPAFGVIEHRRRHGLVARLQLDEAHGSRTRFRPGNGHGRVGGAEVDGTEGRRTAHGGPDERGARIVGPRRFFPPAVLRRGPCSG